MTNRFADVSVAQVSDYDILNNAYLDDPNPNKVDLIDGIYKDENGEPWVPPVVRLAEQIVTDDETVDHVYLPGLGLESFTNAALILLFGSNNSILEENRIFSVQSLSGTGALRIGAEFLANICKYTVFYYPQPTWALHCSLFTKSGFRVAKTYRYWDKRNRCLDFDGLIEDLSAAPKNSVIILQPGCHNPTGCDPTQEQWELIANICEERDLFPFFDFAYQGFASGDMDVDAWVIRYFASRTFEMFVAHSFAKNFSLYDERIGHLAVVTNNKSVVPQIKSNFKNIIEGIYLSPPRHGAQVIATILTDPELTAKWKESVSVMATRIEEIRRLFVEILKQMKTPGSWDHIASQVGMFAYTELTKKQVEYMIQKYHVYLHWNGRINVCGINKNNLQYVANAMYDSIISNPDENSKN